MQDNQLGLKKLIDLSRRADSRCCYAYSDFLDAAQQSDMIANSRELAGKWSLEGGYPNAERRIAVFGSEELCGYPPELPLKCVKIAPKSERFAGEMGHRDFLGSLMALGVKREVLGDIVIADGCGYLMCIDTIASYIADNLEQVRRTSVACEIIDEMPAAEVKIQTERVNVASERLDAVLSAVWHMSRSESARLIKAQRVFVSARLCENCGAQLKIDDTVSARGFGKFIYRGMEKETKKGRLFVVIDRLV